MFFKNMIFVIVALFIVGNANSTSFIKFENMTIVGNDAGGDYSLAHLHMGMDECEKLCELDKGCKSFEVGKEGTSAAGDCFLSYDDRKSAASSYMESELYDYYERNSSASVLGNFKKYADSYISGSNAGGFHDIGTHTPEACAQRCLSDPECRSFEVGTWSIRGRCLISHDNTNSSNIVEVPWYTSWSYDFYELQEASRSDSCADGEASTTGFNNSTAGGTHPTCEQCPSNTYMSRGRTKCIACPENHSSGAGSASIHDCISDIPPMTGFILEIGDFWTGRYISRSDDHPADDGEIVIEVTGYGMDTMSFKVMVNMKGRQFRTDYYGIMTLFELTETTVNLNLTFDSWIGDFSESWNLPLTIHASINQTEQGATASMLGKFAGEPRSSIHVSKRCDLPPEPQPFHAGDHWVGSFSCYDVFRYDTREYKTIDLIIVESDGVTADAIVEMRTRFGTGRYKVSGTYDSTTGRIEFKTTSDDAWIELPYVNVFKTSTLVGVMTDDHLTITGEVAENEACSCGPYTITTGSGWYEQQIGDACIGYGLDLGDITNDWCFTSTDCPDFYGYLDPENYPVKLCDVEDCIDFVLHRVCAPEDESMLCGCTGEVDEKDHGGECASHDGLPVDATNEGELTWCYVDEECSQGFDVQTSGKTFAFCGSSAGTELQLPTTTLPTPNTETLPPPMTTRNQTSSQTETLPTVPTTNMPNTTRTTTNATSTSSTTMSMTNTDAVNQTTTSMISSTSNATITTSSSASINMTSTSSDYQSTTTSGETSTNSSISSTTTNLESTTTQAETTDNQVSTTPSPESSTTTTTTTTTTTATTTTTRKVVTTLPVFTTGTKAAGRQSTTEASGTSSGSSATAIGVTIAVLLLLLLLIVLVMVRRRRQDSVYMHAPKGHSFSNPMYAINDDDDDVGSLSNPLYGQATAHGYRRPNPNFSDDYLELGAETSALNT